MAVLYQSPVFDLFSQKFIHVHYDDIKAAEKYSIAVLKNLADNWNYHICVSAVILPKNINKELLQLPVIIAQYSIFDNNFNIDVDDYDELDKNGKKELCAKNKLFGPTYICNRYFKNYYKSLKDYNI